MGNNHYIELALWNKFSIFKIFFDSLSGDIPCIRYDDKTFVYLDRYPKFVSTKRMNITYSEKRTVSSVTHERGKRHLEKIVKNKYKYNSGREFLEDYIRIIKDEEHLFI